MTEGVKTNHERSSLPFDRNTPTEAPDMAKIDHVDDEPLNG